MYDVIYYILCIVYCIIYEYDQCCPVPIKSDDPLITDWADPNQSLSASVAIGTRRQVQRARGLQEAGPASQ